MEALSKYLLSVTVVSIICAIFSTLIAKKSTVNSILKLLMGIILALTVIHPVVNLRITQVHWYIDELSADAHMAASYGKEMSMLAMEEIIKEKTQAYILDKAALLGADLDVKVTLKDLVPVQVHLTGSISPNSKTRLSTWIMDNLGISKEAQYWHA